MNKGSLQFASRFFALLLLGCLSWPAFTHEVRPAFLELREVESSTVFDVLWKVPSRGEGIQLKLYLRMPEGTTSLDEPRRYSTGTANIERWRAHHPEGLQGKKIRIDGLSSSATDVLVRIEYLDGSSQVARLVPTSAELTITGTPDSWQVMKTYLLLGVEHILLGIDHLLFVFALLLLLDNWKRLVATVTAFTVAHSITLALATLGLLSIPGPPVEVCIALSIAFLAAEIIHRQRGLEPLTWRKPWIVAFGFGLLHGLGFAGALQNVGLPAADIPLALLFFNVGVECGQILFILAALPLIHVARRVASGLPATARTVTPYAIGTLAMFWTLERIAAF